MGKPWGKMMRYVLRRGLRQLILILVIGSAVVVGGLVIEDKKLITAVGVVAALAFMKAFPRRERSFPRERGTVGRPSALAPFCFRYTWTTVERPDLADAARELAEQGLASNTDVQSGRKVVLKGGSQLRLRLLGSYFVRPEHLPTLVELTLTDDSYGEGPHTLRLEVSDRMFIAIRGKRMEDCYGLAAAQIREVVERSLGLARQAEASQ